MKVWVLTKKDRIKNYQAGRFQEEAEYLGIRLQHVCAEDFEIIEPSDSEGKIWYKGRYVGLPDVLITRVTGMTYFGHALVRLFEKMGVKVMNTSHSIELAEDKLRTIQVLSRKNLPVPKSILAKFPVDLDYVTEKLTFPMIMKTVLGAKGEGVLMYENYNQLKDVTTILQKTTEGKVNLIFQEFIKASFGKDIRVFVVGNKAIGAVIRKGAEGQFKANVSAGGSAEFYSISPDLAKLAVEASQALGLAISGVDFLIDENQYWIGEVNSSPSFEGFEKTAKINVPKIILEHILSSQ
jgi:gamma-F420-2:alpha-L-glutamate ligase